ncbi:MAG: ATP-binding cassette domain-containing protein [Myxococcaceae bacterium]|nr:ATP-binding cassette domain-containing protein [Myxococcaceae bacterium]
MGSELHVKVRVPGRLDVELSVPPGITVLFGPSGAGKSTCLSVIAGLLEPEVGSTVKLGDVELSKLPAHERRVALMFQSLALFPHLTAHQNVAYGARAPGEATKWLERMRVQHVAARRPGQLSGGEAQRVALARALASEPRVLLLDEPFSAMDFELRRALRDEVRGIVAQLQLPTLLVTHDRDDAAELAARVVRLSEGRVTAVGPPDEVLSSR